VCLGLYIIVLSSYARCVVYLLPFVCSTSEISLAAPYDTLLSSNKGNRDFILQVCRVRSMNFGMVKASHVGYLLSIDSSAPSARWYVYGSH